MSMKMNAQEMAAKRYPYECTVSDVVAVMQAERGGGYAAAIREVAQPIADERDAYREAMEVLVGWNPTCRAGIDDEAFDADMERIRATLEKYPKP